MGQAKLRGTRDERVHAAKEAAKSAAQKKRDAKDAEELAWRVRKDKEARLRDEEALKAGKIVPKRMVENPRRLGLVTSAIIAAALGSMTPISQRQPVWDPKHPPKDLEEFDRWQKGQFPGQKNH